MSHVVPVRRPLVRPLAGAAVSAVALAALVLPGTASASVTVDCAADNAPLLAAAQTAAADAKAVRLAANRPLGRLMEAERRETRTEARTARKAIHTLRAEARDQDLTTEEQDALRDELRVQAAELRHALRMLDSKRLLLAEIKAERTAAKAAHRAARVALAELEAALAACTTDEDPVEDEDPEVPVTP